MIAVDQSLCNGCEACVEACPTSAIAIENEKAQGTDAGLGPQTMLSLTWLATSLERASHNGPASQDSLHAR